MMKSSILVVAVFLYAGTYTFAQNGLKTNSPSDGATITYLPSKGRVFNILDADTAAISKSILIHTTQYKDVLKKYKQVSQSISPRLRSHELTDIKSQHDSILLAIKELKTKKDSITFLIVKENVLTQDVTWLPWIVESRAIFDIVYDNNGKRFTTLSNAGFNFGDRSGSVYTDIVNGNVGLIRASIGTMITSSNSPNNEKAKLDDAYQRLVTYGGNTVLMLEYPVLYWHNRRHDFNLLTRAITKGAADLPAFGTMTDKFAGSGSFGIDIYLDIATTNNALKFFGTFTGYKIIGSNTFRDNLGVTKNNFNLGQVTLGLIFLSHFKVSFIVATVSSQENLRGRNVVGGGQVLR